MNNTVVSAILSVGLIGLPVAAIASEAQHENAGPEAHAPHLNKIELIFANTHTDHGENAFTLGLSYNYRFSQMASVGVLGEYAFEPHNATTIGIPFKVYPGEGWVLTAMPGMQFHNGHEKPLFRIGAGYEFELETVSLTPEFSVDFVEDEVEYVFGIAIGFGF